METEIAAAAGFIVCEQKRIAGKIDAYRADGSKGSKIRPSDSIEGRYAMKRGLAVCAFVSTVIALATAADFWNSKPYQKWSKGETIRVLTDSPWAKTVSLRKGTLSESPRTFGGAQGVEDSRAEVTIWYTVSIRSSLPVRQANARLAALNQKYDKMDAPAKKGFDDNWNKYLENKFDVIVIAVSYESNDPSLQRRVAAAMQAQTLETMKPTTSLFFSDGKKLEPVGFAAGPREMQIAFPRPTGLAANSSFSFEFMHTGVANQAAQPIVTKFSLKEMNFQGEPAL